MDKINVLFDSNISSFGTNTLD